MNLGFFTMPIHPLEKDWRRSLKEDREAFLLADELGLTEAYVGEHVTDRAENITSCIAFLAWIAAATKRIKLGTGTINMPNTHPAAVAASVAMLDHMLDGRLIFGLSPGVPPTPRTGAWPRACSLPRTPKRRRPTPPIQTAPTSITIVRFSSSSR